MIRTKRFSNLLALTLLGIWATLFLSRASSSLFRFEPPYFGSGDFIEYWSAYRLLESGANPYSEQEMLKIQREVFPSTSSAKMMWNPPWVLGLLWPVLNFDFLTSVRLWLLINVVLAISAALLIRSAWEEKGHFLLTIALGLFFVPVWNALFLGQVSILVSFGVCLLYWGLVRERFFLAGLSLPLLSLKPHLVFLILAVLLHRLLLDFKWSFFWAAIMGFFVSVIPVLIINPLAFEYWLHRLETPPSSELAVPMQAWRTATLIDPIRQFFSGQTSGYVYWPMVAVPLAAVLLSFLAAMFLLPKTPWKLLFPPLCAVSYLFSPYGWLFDQSMLLPLYIGCLICLFKLASGKTAGVLLVALLGLQPFVYLLIQNHLTHHQQLFWYPIPLLIIWLCCQNSAKQQSCL